MSEYLWQVIQEHLQEAVQKLAEEQFPYLYLPQEKADIKYTPPIVDDAGIDIYNRVPEQVKQEIRDNIWRYLEQVQRDYPPDRGETKRPRQSQRGPNLIVSRNTCASLRHG
jgi:hypothetical protein